MLQYILNTSAIWVMSLVVFDLFLRRLSHHGYNRFYLIATFLLGLVLPLLTIDFGEALPSTSSAAQMRDYLATQKTVATVNGQVPFNIWSIIYSIYFIGVAITLVLLIKDLYKIVSLYSAGTKTIENGYTIIETGQNHGPFSVFNWIFISAQTSYNNEEWNILLAHEQMHGKLGHIADVVLMQLARIVFWFHPLVIVYQKRLLMVHEFQADWVSHRQPEIYCRFLIEQSMLQAAPLLTHSFNRSPIKNRISMLTHQSPATARLRMLVLAPVIIVSVVFFSNTGFSQKFEQNGNTISYKGNKFEMSPAMHDTIAIVDPVTGVERTMVTTLDPKPITMNGNKIYNSNELNKKTTFNIKEASIKEYLMNQIGKKLSQLPNGYYNMQVSNIVIDEKGKLVFYTFNGLTKMHIDKNDQAAIPVVMKNEIDKNIHNALNNLEGTPGQYQNTNAPSLVTEIDLNNSIEIKDHKIISKP